ncbi:Transmembrane emp24 domain-containing protein 10 [Cichlidogyrus casuarinus]|uniref:Transmembrane emp24 domain-containing protein 10 n=1 Tax=Cichlidogyrus casuarinus TaxID=1844966 RepID=A0ABD2QGU3_9PLAT
MNQSFLSFLYFCLLFVSYSNAIRFHLPTNGHRCVKDEVFRHVVVSGDYEVEERAGVSVRLEVTDKDNHVLYTKADAKKGKFSFSIENFDVFDVCFTSSSQDKSQGQLEVTLQLLHGEETKDYDSLAKAEKLKPLEIELRKLEDISEGIVKDFVAMHQRADSMRSTNESTHSRVLWFSIISMLCLITLACWQVLYLRKYFKSKKLIE